MNAHGYIFIILKLYIFLNSPIFLNIKNKFYRIHTYLITIIVRKKEKIMIMYYLSIQITQIL